MKSAVFFIWFLLAFCPILCFPASIAAQSNYPDIQEALAVVNGTPITQIKIDRELRLIRAAISLNLLLDRNEMVNVADYEILENLIDRELVFQRAQIREIRIQSRWIDDELVGLKARIGDEAGYLGYLSDIHMTEDQLRDHLRVGLMIRRQLRDEVIRWVRVSEVELHSFYNEHPDYFTRPSQVRALHIMVAVADETQRGEALLKLRVIERELSQGADFGVLAVEYSDCPSKSKGGDLGYFTYDQIIPALADVAFAMQPGQLSQVIYSSLGFHILKVIDRRPPSLLAFRNVRDKIELTIRRNKENRSVKAYLANLKKKAEIVRYKSAP